MVVKSGDSTIYLATYTSAEPTIGELRFIARLNSQILPNQYPYDLVSTTGGSSSTVEGSDVFVVNGQTRSKFYSSERFIDDTVVSIHARLYQLWVILTTRSTALTAALSMHACS
jgi:rhamnogalacturonan endolyase